MTWVPYRWISRKSPNVVYLGDEVESSSGERLTVRQIFPDGRVRLGNWFGLGPTMRTKGIA